MWKKKINTIMTGINIIKIASKANIKMNINIKIQESPREDWIMMNSISNIGIIKNNGIQTVNGAIKTKQLMKKNGFHINIYIKVVQPESRYLVEVGWPSCCSMCCSSCEERGTPP